MTERPILFSAAMVRALLAGTKTQTRRIVKPQPHGVALVASGNHLFDYRDDLGDYSRVVPMDKAVTLCPHGLPGDLLWVREAFNADRAEMVYRADGGMPADWFDAGSKWRPSIHMPRRASRITLEITMVRVQRLQDISEEDARAEGAPGYEEGIDAPPPDDEHEWAYLASFIRLWKSINGAESWNANPWVWAISFKRLTP